MAPSIPLLYILFTIGALPKFSNCNTQVEPSLHFLEEPKDVVGVIGKPLTIPCKPGRTNPQKDVVEIKWYHNNALLDLSNDGRRSVLPNGTLHFSKIVHRRSGHSDQGEYRCVIAKENGSLSSRPGFLRISVLPKSFSRHPAEQTVETGSNVRFSCEIDLFSELEIEWEKDGEKLPQNDLKYLTDSGPDVRGSVLYIFDAGLEDSGSYRCTVRNLLLNKHRVSSSGSLTVLPRGEESDINKNSFTFLSAQPSLSSSFTANLKKIKEGDNVSLDCVTNGSPTPVLVWNYLPHGANKSLFVFEKTNAGYNVLRIRNITRHQAGWYTCTAVNLPRREVTTEVQVLTAPEIREKSENIVFLASKTVRIRCAASGNPLPGIYWLKDGDLFNFTARIKHRTSVNESEQLRLSELILSSTVTGDAGIYQCIANNSVGLTWAASRLILNATGPPPKAPEKVACETLSSSQIKVTWDVPNSVDKIKAFTVHYHQSENDTETQKLLSGDSRSTQIDELLPFTNYTFYVRLYVVSASEFSREIVCQTGEEVPIEAPRMKAKIASPSSVHLSWSPLPKEKARGVVNQYKIQWRIVGSPFSKAEKVTSDVTDYTITGLIPGKNYKMRVLASTSKGWPDADFPWETLEIPLNYNNLPSAPDVKLQAINSSSIEVRWSLSNKGTEVKGYKIFYRTRNSGSSGPVTTPPDVKEYIITGLDPETWYEVTVLGFTGANDGETGSSSIRTLSSEGSSNQLSLDFASLEPPTSLEADPVSPVAINLSWTSPQVSGPGRINYYIVCFNSVKTSRNKNSTPTCVKSLETTLLVMDLVPFTLYEFKVKCHDVDNNHSAFSQAVECHTLEDVPGPVADVCWKALNKTTVQVTWKKPKQCNGIVKNYTVSYTQNSNLPLSQWQVTDLTPNVNYFLLVRASTSAGLGSYGSTKQFLIPSLAEFSDEAFAKTTKNKHTDHYIGIMVGLGIGLCCIIFCTTCILCRRKCLKRHITQGFEGNVTRFPNGNDCRREREAVREPLEAEYFTFLSTQGDRLNPAEVTLQNLDAKLFQGRCSNGSASWVKMSLLIDGKTQNEGGKNISITENPRYNPNCSESPLLKPKAHVIRENGRSEPCERFNFLENRRPSSKSLRTGKRYSLEVRIPIVLYNNNNFEGKNQRTSEHEAKVPNWLGDDIAQNSIDGNEGERLSEDEYWLDLNSVLKNPDFRFSNPDSEKFIKRKNGFVFSGPLQNTPPGRGGVWEKDIGQTQPNVCEPSTVTLRMLSKEITLKS